VKKLLALSLCLGLVVILTAGLTGCDKGTKPTKTTKTTTTTEPGGGGSKDKKNEVTVAAKDGKLTIKAGENGMTKLTLGREKDATEEATVTVAVDPDGKGVEASTDTATVKGDATDAGTLTIKTDKAKVKAGDFIVTVTVKSKGSKDATAKVEVKVTTEAAVVPPKKAYDIAVTGPEKPVTIKQGAKADVTAKIALGKDLTDAALTAGVKDKDDKDAKGVSVKLDSDKMTKSGDAKATVTVADDAVVGEYTLWITAANKTDNKEGGTAKVTVKVEKK